MGQLVCAMQHGPTGVFKVCFAACPASTPAGLRISIVARWDAAFPRALLVDNNGRPCAPACSAVADGLAFPCACVRSIKYIGITYARGD